MFDGAALAAIGAVLGSSARRARRRGPRADRRGPGKLGASCSTARKTGDGATLGARYYSLPGASYYK
ncbi:hypothetical protein [Polyangium jinanense]|uniref:Uncharacterized protein n=1 Tax=Polyangium jinanense TaxID=2829994 RepID=A0A9X3XEF7_9BACT|nr:hypothetical protein [Polyangium jinanense]MDC3988802.1 hypothetical protein [Polyangium jinanense]